MASTFQQRAIILFSSQLITALIKDPQNSKWTERCVASCDRGI